MRRIVRVVPFFVAMFVFVLGPTATTWADPPGIRWVQAKHVQSIHGADVYDAYCAACHGKTGRGDGPAVKFLSEPVPDLTRICERDGKFDRRHVEQHVISDARPLVAMAKWDEVLRNNYSSEPLARIAMFNLTRHIEGLQVTNGTRATR